MKLMSWKQKQSSLHHNEPPSAFTNLIYYLIIIYKYNMMKSIYLLEHKEGSATI